MSCHSTHVGIAATGYAKAITDLDDAQVSSVFHRLKSAHRDAPAPEAEEAIATLVRMRREVLEDVRLEEATAYRIADRYAHAIEAVNRGQIPDGKTWAAMQQTAMEAEIADRNLANLITASARYQRKSPERLAATFRKWRRSDDYEDLEAPDPAFRPDPDGLPSDKHTARALRKLGFENYLAQRLPVFTYGTLRKNQGNERLMLGAIADRSEDAEISGVCVYGAGRGFPYAAEAADGVGITRGDIVWLKGDQDGDWARDRLDSLEGFDSDRFSDSHYRRVAWDVTYADPQTGQTRTTRAWTYLAGAYAQESLTDADKIADGDWVKARDAYRSQRSSRPSTGYQSTGGGYDGEIVYTKRSTDPEPARSAADSASVFAQAGLIEEEPDDNAGFWSQFR